MMEPETAARRYLRTNYGNMVMLGSYAYEEEPRLHRFTLRSSYPFLVRDDSDSGKLTVRILKMEKLGSIYFDDNLHVDRSLTSRREEIISRIRETLTHWRNRIEEIIASTTSLNLSGLNYIYSYFIPVEGIVSILLDNKEVIDADFKGMERDRRRKYMMFIRLLEGQDLLVRRDGGWKPTIGLKEIFDYDSSLTENTRRVVAILIAERYRTLKKDFNMTLLDGPIKMQNVIFLPEIEIEHTLSRKRDTLSSEYFYHYNKPMARMDLVRHLKNLVSIESIEYNSENETYRGDEDLLAKMIRQKETLTPIGTLHKSVA